MLIVALLGRDGRSRRRRSDDVVPASAHDVPPAPVHERSRTRPAPYGVSSEFRRRTAVSRTTAAARLDGASVRWSQVRGEVVRMSREQLFLVRAEALTMSGVSMPALDRAAADAAIRATVRAFGGVRNCAAAFAYECGEHPDITAERMRSARRAVAVLYGPGPGAPAPRAAGEPGSRSWPSGPGAGWMPRRPRPVVERRRGPGPVGRRGSTRTGRTRTPSSPRHHRPRPCGEHLFLPGASPIHGVRPTSSPRSELSRMGSRIRVTYATLSADNEDLHTAYEEGLQMARSWLGTTIPTRVGTAERTTGRAFDVTGPGDLSVRLCTAHEATAADVDDAVAAAKASGWRHTPVAGAGRDPAPGRRPDQRPVGGAGRADEHGGRQEPAGGARRRRGVGRPSSATTRPRSRTTTASTSRWTGSRTRRSPAACSGRTACGP